MKDVGLVPDQKQDPVSRAVIYLARRIQHDPDLAYLISRGTGSYDVLKDAISHLYPSENAEEALRCRETERESRFSRLRRLEGILDANGIEY